MRHLLAGDAQVADAVARGAGGEEGADAGGVRVTHAAARAGLRARVGRHAGREVVRLQVVTPQAEIESKV